jgi:hypothetical protein
MAAKEKPKTEESQNKIETRQEIRKEWSAIEPKVIEMAHKLEDSKLIDPKDYVWIRGKISNLAKHFDRQ